MGLITSPDVSFNPWALKFVTYSGYVSALCLVAGAGFLFVMPHHEFSHKTYFSENALLPGLVIGGFDEDLSAEIYLEGLREEMKRYPSGVPFAWLESQLKQIGLEVYKHNFTLNYPFSGKEPSSFKGENLYAILRAPRSSSTEALILSSPFRAPYSVESPTDVSISLLLAAAKYFRVQNYWAKDIIFLITMHEQLGMQAWLEAYHQTTSGSPGILDHGELEARAGSIQAAINLEFGKETITHVNVKIQGLNGQLPNLDLFNLINRLCTRDGVGQLFEGRKDPKSLNFKGYQKSLSTLLSMMMKQATGVPAGNHGLFHRMGIEAVTLEGVDYNAVRNRQLVGSSSGKKRKNVRRYQEVDMYQMGRIIEGTFRSLNNLLERFHQSFFYYVLPGTSRYVSIGMYMPGFGLIAGSLVISALSLWLQSLGQATAKENKEVLPIVPLPDIFSRILPLFLFYHLLGLALLYSPAPVNRMNNELNLGFHSDDAITYAIAMVCLVSATLPFVKSRFTSVSPEELKVVKCFTLLEIAALSFGISLCNFSLSYLVTGFVVAPLALLSSPVSGMKFILKVFSFLVMTLGHPLVLMTIMSTFDAYRIADEESSILQIFGNGLNAGKHALMYSITDGYIYGNVMYSLGCVIYIPCWSLLWAIFNAR